MRALRAKLRPWTLPDSDALAERTRALFARVVGADERAGGADAIAITPSTSYAISQAARNLEPLCERGAKVLVLEDQMSSNVYAWQALCARTGAVLTPVPYPADGDWTRALCERDDAPSPAGSVAVKWEQIGAPPGSSRSLVEYPGPRTFAAPNHPYTSTNPNFYRRELAKGVRKSALRYITKTSTEGKSR